MYMYRDSICRHIFQLLKKIADYNAFYGRHPPTRYLKQQISQKIITYAAHRQNVTVLPNLKFLAQTVPEIWMGPKISKVGHVTSS